MKTVTVRLDRFGQEALDEYVRGSGGSQQDAVDVAVRYYLADSGSGRMAWRVPRQAAEADPEEGLELELELDGQLQRQLEAESRRQRVSPDLLAMHALMYFLADLDSGRAAARLGDAIDRDAEAN
ncbi:MAG: hypothetical protein ACRDN8_09260 [Thermoleophilaceae bacterium]